MSKREEQVLVRFTGEERKLIEKAAVVSGETVAGLVRRAAVGEARDILREA